MLGASGYAIEGELGRGGMGRVFRVRHKATGAVRALKVLDATNDLEAVERFRREAEALAKAAGAGAVPVHETGLEQGRLFFVMDLMPGGSLRDRLTARGRLPWPEAAALVARLARMLERCHALGLVHRDLKPENVLFDESGTPYLADFGCARDGASSLTEAGALLGTLAYMSPEQLEGRAVDGRADVFALAVVLHELVAGKRPFAGRSWPELLRAIEARARDPLEGIGGAPSRLEAIVARALAREIGGRHASAAELARDLEALAPSKREEPGSPPRRGLAVAIAIALAASALAVGAARWTRAAPPPAPVPRGPAAPAPRLAEQIRAVLAGDGAPGAELVAAIGAAWDEDEAIRSDAVALACRSPAPFVEAFEGRGEPHVLLAFAWLAGGVEARRAAVIASIGSALHGRDVRVAAASADALDHAFARLALGAFEPADGKAVPVYLEDPEAWASARSLAGRAGADLKLLPPALRTRTALSVLLEPVTRTALGAATVWWNNREYSKRLADVLEPVVQAIEIDRCPLGLAATYAIFVPEGPPEEVDQLSRELEASTPDLSAELACAAQSRRLTRQWVGERDRAETIHAVAAQLPALEARCASVAAAGSGSFLGGMRFALHALVHGLAGQARYGAEWDLAVALAKKAHELAPTEQLRNDDEREVVISELAMDAPAAKIDYVDGWAARQELGLHAEVLRRRHQLDDAEDLAKKAEDDPFAVAVRVLIAHEKGETDRARELLDLLERMVKGQGGPPIHLATHNPERLRRTLGIPR